MRTLCFAFFALLAGVSGQSQDVRPADRIWLNGRIVTMNAAGATFAAVAVRGDEIVAVGTDAAMRRMAAPSTVITDLGGKTMLPGFYAAHDHFPGAGSVGLYRVDLSSPPVGSMRSIDDIVAALRKKAAETKAGEWIIGHGYDDTLLREKRHPNRADLDRASSDHPIWIEHVSGHLGAANSLALERAHIARDTRAANGVVWKDSKTGEPTGVFEECGGLVSSHIPAPTAALRLEAVRRADAEYLARGVTTAAIAGVSRATFTSLAGNVANDLIHLRLVAMLAIGANTPATRAQAQALAETPDRLAVGALKMFADGSIQGYTGYLTAAYYRPPEGKPDYRGYARHSRAELTDLVRKWHRAGYQIAIHANGDAAIDDVLYAYRTAQREFPRADARHRIEHLPDGARGPVGPDARTRRHPIVLRGPCLLLGRPAPRYLSRSGTCRAHQSAGIRGAPGSAFHAA